MSVPQRKDSSTNTFPEPKTTSIVGHTPQRGLSDEEQKGLLRAIKEERLKVHLCNLSKLCGWQSLEEGNKELFDKALKVNTSRNKIIHGSRRLGRTETIDACNILIQLIDWLRGNPFGFQIPNFPRLQVAEATFSIIPLKDQQEQQDVKPPDFPNESPMA